MGSYSKWMMWEESPIIQSIFAPAIDVTNNLGIETIKQILGRTIPDPSLALMHSFSQYHVDPTAMGKNPNDLTLIAQYVFRAAGIIPPIQGVHRDSLGKILADRFKIQKWSKWKKLFGADYLFVLGLLSQAERYYKYNPTTWLSYQASFNDALFRTFQLFLASKGAPGAIPLSNPLTGKLCDIGTLYNHGGFKSVYPQMSINLALTNERRSQLPQIHPYQKKTGGKAVPLRKREQLILLDRMRTVYNEIIQEVTNLGI